MSQNEENNDKVLNPWKQAEEASKEELLKLYKTAEMGRRYWKAQYDNIQERKIIEARKNLLEVQKELKEIQDRLK